VGDRRQIMVSGIYQIKNLVNGKVYIGSSVNIEGRWKEHKRDLKQNKHHNIYLQNSYNKHGGHNFIFEVLEEVQNKELLVETEQKHMDVTSCYNRDIGYNISLTAGSTLGYRHTDESKKKFSGKNHPMFGKTGEKNPNFGKEHTPETKKKFSEQKLGEKNPMFGKIPSPETKKKLSEARLVWNLGVFLQFYQTLGFFLQSLLL